MESQKFAALKNAENSQLHKPPDWEKPTACETKKLKYKVKYKLKS